MPEKTVHYLNLTNGLLWLDKVKEPRFLRIQSTACEQKRWDFIIQQLPDDFLMNLAIGNFCVIYDASARKAVPRALYQGVILAKFVIEMCWFGHSDSVIVKRCNCRPYFTKVFNELQDSTKKKLIYFKKFLTAQIKCCNIQCVSVQTDKDGDYEYFKKLLG